MPEKRALGLWRAHSLLVRCPSLRGAEYSEGEALTRETLSWRFVRLGYGRSRKHASKGAICQVALSNEVIDYR